jgi:carbonic anhydrase
MSDNIRRILSANKEYAVEYGDRRSLGIIPARKIAILTCMDARIEPLQLAGLKTGDAHIVRNAGGRASNDAVRSLVISNQLVGTNEWLVIHHTDCGLEATNNEEMGKQLRETLNTAEGDFINWMTITDRIESVKDDVKRLRSHPLVPVDVRIAGLLFDVETGLLSEVIKA